MIDVSVLIPVLFKLLVYPIEMIEAVTSIRSVADFIVDLIVFMGLVTVSWSTYSKWGIGDKVGAFFGGWLLVGMGYILASSLNVSYEVMRFTVDSGVIGVLIALIPGIVWKDKTENVEYSSTVRNIGVLATVFALFIFAVAVGAGNIWYVTFFLGSMTALFVYAVICKYDDIVVDEYITRKLRGEA